jgi:hypothetical protein
MSADRDSARATRTFLPRHPVSIVGAGLTTVTAVVFLVVFLGDLFGLHQNPYLGIVLFLVLPAFFVCGLLLIPIGRAIERKRERRGLAPAAWPRIDLNDGHQRQRAGLVIALTAANFVILSIALYGGMEYMATPSFCGQICHQAMEPEFVAHQWGPHASVACVSCHVGPNATHVAESKLAGIRRVWAVAAGSFRRPIPPPLNDLLPARDTCERCHWPEQFHGDRLKQVHEYADDEANTETITTLRVHVGGGSERLGTPSGIHWHMNIANRVEFIATDPARQVIPYVRMILQDGTVREYLSPGVTKEDLAGFSPRQMDCMDCHNRPAHQIAASAIRAVDASLATGELPRTLPFIKREAARVLEAEYATRDAALEAIAQALGDFYRGPEVGATALDEAEVARAIRGVQAIYQRNVFPAMGVAFGTYPDNIGHVDFPGCFRCHDEEHATSDGQTISQDCESCHAME